MPFSVPEVGLVIGYSYLWRLEAKAGQHEGTKDRPCAIVLKKYNKVGKTIVVVVPITHTPPADPDIGFEIPLSTKQRLGLDSARSWVIANEVNRFEWPGYDLRPVSPHEPDRFHYGFLPPSLLAKIVKAVHAHAKKQRLHIVPRSD